MVSPGPTRRPRCCWRSRRRGYGARRPCPLDGEARAMSLAPSTTSVLRFPEAGSPERLSPPATLDAAQREAADELICVARELSKSLRVGHAPATRHLGIFCTWPGSSVSPSPGCTQTRATTAPRTANSVDATASRLAKRTAQDWVGPAASLSMIVPGCWPTSAWIGARQAQPHHPGTPDRRLHVHRGQPRRSASTTVPKLDVAGYLKAAGPSRRAGQVPSADPGTACSAAWKPILE
jgi:hypothetical protein